MRNEIKNGFDMMDRRLDALDQARKTFRQVLTADSFLSQLVTGEFEDRIEALEPEFAALEAMK